MRRLLLVPVVVLALTASACSTVGDQLDDLQGRAGELGDRAQFCFAIARALTSLDGGSSTDEARDAAEEILAQAPDELRADAELVADRVRAAAEADDPSLLRDGDLREAAERLRDRTRERCDLTR